MFGLEEIREKFDAKMAEINNVQDLRHREEMLVLQEIAETLKALLDHMQHRPVCTCT
jgi:hypothetical protein